MKVKHYIFIVLIIFFDQTSKFIVGKSMNLLESIKIINNFFYLTLAHNTGAAWSLFSGMQDFFSIVAIIVSGGIIYYLNKNKTSSLTKIALIFIVGGAIGNAIDRIVYGYVIDFLDFYIFSYDFPIFNIADSFLTIGMFILIIIEIFSKEDVK